MYNLSRIWKLFDRVLKIKFIFLIIFILIGTFFEMFSLSLLLPIMSVVYDGGSLINDYATKYNFNFPKEFLNLNYIIFFFIVFYFFKTIYLIFVSHYQTNFIFSFFTKLLNRLFKKYIYENYLFHMQNKTPELLRNLMGEIHKVAVGYVGAVTNIILESIVIIGILSLLFIFQPNFITGAIIIVGFLIFIILFILKKKISGIGLKQQNYSYLNLKYALEALGGIKEIKVANAENKVSSEYENNSILLLNTNYLLGLLNSLPKIIIEFGIVMLILFVLLLLKYNNYSPEIILSYLTIILGVFIKIFPSISKISISFININFYKPSVDLLFEKIIFKKENIKTEETINEETIKELNFTKDIQIKKISFSYPGSKKLILNELSLNIKKGETIGIMGETGSGKSTLANIIIGLVSPNNGGTVKVDGKNIQTNITGWYEKIGYVPQQVFLNNDTLKNNIIFYKNYHQADNKKIIEAIKSSQLEDFFISKNNDLNFMVGEDGKNLSGGQKQRIGIARSLYKDPELLIFDESTSSLDDKTEAKFVETINSIKDKTIIIISHKKSTLKNCDKIHYLNNGKILNDND